MPLNFPSSPTPSTSYTFNNKTWTFNGSAWALSSGGTLNTSIVPEGSNLYFSNARVYANVSQLGYITSASLSGYATNIQLTSFATTANSLSQFASTTSDQLRTLVSDETGSGNLVFSTSPTLETPVLGLATGTSVMLSANIGAAAGNVTGNFTVGTLQTAGNVNATSALFTTNVAAGNVRLTSNGALTFADGSRQTTAATSGVTTGKSIAMAIVFGG